MDQHVIKMAALGRRFQLGDLYNYHIDQILTEYRCESADLPSGTQTETDGFNMKLLCPDSDITHKWQHIGLDGHLQASILAGLFETEAEVDKLRGASHYVNAKFNPIEVTRTFIIRAIIKKHRLDLPNFLNNSFATDGNKLPDATHIVVGIAYGAEVYCVLAQNVLDEYNDDREKITEFLNHVSSMMKVALEGKQDEDEFKELFTNEEKKLVDQIQCRFYADDQIQPVRECSLFNAYKHCLKLVQVENIEKSVPVVAVLCPLEIVMKASEKLEKKFEYRDVDAGLVARCCKISTELDLVISTSESLHLSYKKSSCRHALRKFTQVVSKFQDLLKISWKKSIVKARESQDEDDQEVEKVVHIAETHPLFNISRLIRWLRFKKAEMEMVEKLFSINGITFLAGKTQLEKELVFSFDKRHTLVLVIPSLDQSTKDLLCSMKNYVDKNTELVAGDAEDSCDEIGLPWHMDIVKRKQVLDKIREMVDFVKKNKHLENDVQFFILPEEDGKEFGCSYSIYRADNLLKDNLSQLPTSYDETCIGDSEFSKVIDTLSTLNTIQTIDVEHQRLQEVSIPVGISQNTLSTVVDELKLLRELVTNLTKESNETKSALIETVNQLEEKIKKSTECLQEMEKTNATLIEELRETAAESRKLMEMSEVIDRHKAIVHRPLLQGEAKIAIEKKWFDTIELTYPNVKAMEDLILQGVSVNAEDIFGQTALHCVCRKNKNENLVDLVRLLVAYGADVNAKEQAGWTALHLVCMKNKSENLIDVVRFLVKNGVDVNAKTYAGNTALHFLCLNYQNNNLIDIVQLFVASGVDFNAKDNEGRTALHFLCQYYKDDNLIDVIRFLVANGVDVNALNRYGRAPRDLIRQFYKKENAKELLKLLSE